MVKLQQLQEAIALETGVKTHYRQLFCLTFGWYGGYRKYS